MTPDTYQIANGKTVEQGTIVFHISGSAGTIGPGEYFRTGFDQILLENLDDYFATQKEAYQASLDREINKRSRIVTQHPAYDHQKVLLQKINLLKGVEFIESQQEIGKMKMTDVEVGQWICNFLKSNPNQAFASRDLWLRICQENFIPSVQIRIALANLQTENKIRFNKKRLYELAVAS